MKTTHLNTDQAKSRVFALLDRRHRNAVNRQLFTDAEQLKAEQMRMVLLTTHKGAVVYEPSYGTTGFSVKVVGFITDAGLLSEIETEWALQGITKRVTPQGVLYRVKK